MRPGPHQKRGRNRSNLSTNLINNGRKQSHLPLRLQTFDSNGGEIRIRGNAYQVHEKYLQLSRDAASSGDRVLAENYMQHAEHYFRIINLNEGNGPQQHPQQGGQQRPYPPQGGQGEQQMMEDGSLAPAPGNESQPGGPDFDPGAGPQPI